MERDDGNREVRMFGLRLVGMMLIVGLLSGCAGMKSSQGSARLQSQIGLLDERVSQLERSAGLGLSAAPIAEPMFDGGTSSGGGSARKSHSTPTPSASYVKPSTREIQQALKNAGFYQGSVDGKMGPVTREAVKEFQRVHGLTDDGVIGRKTWAKLKAYADLSAASGELNAAEPLK